MKRVLKANSSNSFAGLVLETEDGFRLRPENFLAEGERDLLEKILKAPYVFFHLIGKGTSVGVSLPWFSRTLHYSCDFNQIEV